MNFTRLLIVIPLYVIIVEGLSRTGISAFILSYQLDWKALWAIELGALALGGFGAWFYMRPSGYLETNPSIVHASIAHLCFGLVLSSAFGIYALISGRYPWLPGLIVVPLAFGLSELAYYIIMRLWYDRKRRQQEFDDDLR